MLLPQAISGKPKSEALLREYLDNEELIEHILASEISFPEYELISEDILADGDLVAIRGRLVGIHKGDFMGIPPTGNKIDLELFVNYRIASHKIVDHWMLLDSAVVMQQLGVELLA